MMKNVVAKVTLTVIAVGAALTLYRMSLYSEHVKQKLTIPTVPKDDIVQAELPICTSKVLLEYINRTGSHPGEGHWEGDHFLPKLCSLKKSPLSADEITKCFQRNHIQRVATIGDSNGIRFFDALLNHIKKGYKKCKMIRTEAMLNKGFFPEPAYFAGDNMELKSAINVTGRWCRSCKSRQYQCLGSSSDINKIEVEHVSMALMRDQSLTISRSAKNYSSTDSYQEFLFKYYWKDRMPQLILVFSPFCHVKNKGKVIDQLKDIDYFINLVNRYVTDKKTLVYWIPAFAEFESRKDKQHKNLLYEGVLATETLNKLNKHLYKGIHSLLLEKPAQMRGFFDMIPVSLGKEEWTKDGIHMQPIWYQQVTKYILQLLCS